MVNNKSAINVEAMRQQIAMQEMMAKIDQRPKNVYLGLPSYTTVEQEAALLDMGISPQTADFNRIPKCGGYRITTETATNAKPCWSLAGLLRLIPQMLVGKDDNLVYDRRISRDGVEYFCVDYDLYMMSFDGGATLFVNAIACIKWLLMNGYIDKEGRAYATEY